MRPEQFHYEDFDNLLKDWRSVSNENLRLRQELIEMGYEIEYED